MAKSTSNSDIYDLVDRLRLEVKGDIEKLSEKVEQNALKQAVSSTKLGMLITGITLVVSAVTTLIVNRILG